MHISLAQLLFGFKAALTIDDLAAHLGVSVAAVRDRIRAITPAEEAHINTAMEGK